VHHDFILEGAVVKKVHNYLQKAFHLKPCEMWMTEDWMHQHNNALAYVSLLL
jgi:hypothetical protein